MEARAWGSVAGAFARRGNVRWLPRHGTRSPVTPDGAELVADLREGEAGVSRDHSCLCSPDLVRRHGPSTSVDDDHDHLHHDHGGTHHHEQHDDSSADDDHLHHDHEQHHDYRGAHHHEQLNDSSVDDDHLHHDHEQHHDHGGTHHHEQHDDSSADDYDDHGRERPMPHRRRLRRRLPVHGGPLRRRCLLALAPR